ncbi:MAG: right-handed parallel beta-helix repeat-containing protein [Thermoleophilaceae bacterium]|nr:right-handed parallel beta-helix repeat-containing protein [Thermoleophilaceae bacterium]
MLTTCAALCAALLGAGSAAAQPVTCGQVIRTDTKLSSDLRDCPGDGLVIGAHHITLDLNGHTVDGLRRGNPCDPDCLHGRGIDNTGGYDGVRIVNGRVSDFERGVILVGANRNQLSRLDVAASSYGEAFSPVTLVNSHRNRIVDSTMGAGEPALLLVLSDHNTIARSSMSGGITIRQGDGLLLVGSDHNRIADSHVGGAWLGVHLIDSAGNRLVRDELGGYNGNLLDDATRTTLTGNTLTGRGATAVQGDANVISGNSVIAEQGLRIDGDYNRVLSNTKSGGQYGLVIGGGAGTLVRFNRFDNVLNGIHVTAQAADTRVVDNTASANGSDGIRVDAARTEIGRNVANDNGKLGIEAVQGVTDLGGNTATGNGDPLQCVNVFCR